MGFEVGGLGFGFQFSGFGFRVRVSGFGFRVSGFGFLVPGFGFRISGLGFRGSGLAEGPPRGRGHPPSGAPSAGCPCEFRSTSRAACLRVAKVNFAHVCPLYMPLACVGPRLNHSMQVIEEQSSHLIGGQKRSSPRTKNRTCVRFIYRLPLKGRVEDPPQARSTGCAPRVDQNS